MISTAQAICRVCGDPIRTFTLGTICEDCKPYQYIPQWYPKAEQYRPGIDTLPATATRTPKSGVEYLDMRLRKFVFDETILTRSEIKQLQRKERKMGVPED